MNLRNIFMGLFVVGVVAGIVVACGGGGGYGGSSMTPTYSVGGNITGATGTVTLKLNGGSDMTATGPAAQPFAFGTMVASGSTYNVQVAAANQRCTVANGAGTMAGANITNVTVTCGAQTTEMVIRSTILTGALQNPPVTTSATGVGGVIVDPASKAITGGMTFSGLTPTVGGHHIHQAPIGTPTLDGPVIIGLILASDGRTAVVPPGTVLSQPQYDALLAGELYFNVHTVANSGGEIRGQITAQGGVLAGTATLNAAQEVDAGGNPASTSTATGQGTFLADAATRTIIVTYATHNVANATLAHIHTGLTTTTGPVRIGFAGLDANAFGAGSHLASPTQGIPPISAQDALDFGVGYLYFNVHSGNLLCNPGGNTACSSGEIRGNITPIP